MSMETTLEIVCEGSVDLTSQKETVADPDELDSDSNEEPELRKAKTLPSVFSKSESVIVWYYTSWKNF